MTTFNIANVVSFRGFDVRNGQVDISNEQYRDLLDEIYPVVKIGDLSFNPGTIVEDCDPVAFRCGLGDYESEIQSGLEEAIENEDDSDIVWEDGKSPEELDVEEDE